MDSDIKVEFYNKFQCIADQCSFTCYNTEGIKEFWEDSFDEAVWDFGYMLLLVS